LNRALALADWERAQGLVTASAGNHGQGVALAGRLIGAETRVFVSQDAPAVKIAAMRRLGARVELVEGGYHAAEEAGLTYAKHHDAVWISPYNDAHVIAGQGTIASEIVTEVPETAEMTWLVPLSGGGLCAGIGAVLAEQAKNKSETSRGARLIGVQVEAAAFMHAIFYRGSQKAVQEFPSVADGLGGAVEEKSITIPLIKKYVDAVVLVSEEEVKRAIAFAWHVYGEQVEGAGAVGLAAVLSKKVPQGPSVVVVSGGNIQPEIHAEITKKYA
jgi:threonine dehydratase